MIAGWQHTKPLLAGRLETMRKLILNADDFGFDQDTYETTVACFEAGMLSSATIMTGMPYSEPACQFAKENKSRFSFGLHFNIVDGHAAMSGECGSLCNKNNRFYASRLQRLRALMQLLNAEDVRREFRLQVAELLDHGVTISHVDSHGHLHKFPSIIDAIRPELSRLKIYSVRRPQNTYFSHSIRRKAINDFFIKSYKELKYPDNFLAIDKGVMDWPNLLHDVVKSGITEIAIHPGKEESWRHHEAMPLLQPDRLMSIFRESHFQLINYNELSLFE